MSSISKPLGGRVGIVGTGSRAAMFVRGIVARPNSKVVAICEPNSVRAAYYNNLLQELGASTVPVYQPEAFETMLKDEKVETIVVTCVDALHDLYIVPALKAGGKHEQEYNPVHELVKRAIAEGKIGNVLSVHFEWLLDTVHGADYFRRWHRQKSNSGGLMVHKSGHHFDLVNWWLDAEPDTVAGIGKLAFYGDDNGKRHGWGRKYERARNSEAARGDPFAIDLEGDETLKGIYADAEKEDGYYRDQNLTGGQIHGNAPPPNPGEATVKLQRLWQKPELLPITMEHGSHGGGDRRMLSVLFGPLPGEDVDTGDASKQSASERDGAMALAVGLLANESFKDGQFHTIQELSFPL
ncbi:hypothetical protein EIP86_009206 [Pleurotus ostreatoroseus]|nr:hypothetical protein EIP86_009206 [Pleurotus ostreatoroseus]